MHQFLKIYKQMFIVTLKMLLLGMFYPKPSRFLVSFKDICSRQIKHPKIGNMTISNRYHKKTNNKQLNSKYFILGFMITSFHFNRV